MNTTQRQTETRSTMATRNIAKAGIHRAVVLGLSSGALIALGVVLELAALNCVQLRFAAPWLLSLLLSAGRDALEVILGMKDRIWLQMAPLAVIGAGLVTALAAYVTPEQSRIALSGFSIARQPRRDAGR